MTVDLKKLESRLIEIEFGLGMAGVQIPSMALHKSSVCNYVWPVNSVILTATNENPMTFGVWEYIGDIKADQPNVMVYAWKRLS